MLLTLIVFWPSNIFRPIMLFSTSIFLFWDSTRAALHDRQFQIIRIYHIVSLCAVIKFICCLEQLFQLFQRHFFLQTGCGWLERKIWSWINTIFIAKRNKKASADIITLTVMFLKKTARALGPVLLLMLDKRCGVLVMIPFLHRPQRI